VWTQADLVEAVRDEPVAAAKALAFLPWNGEQPLTPASIEAAAKVSGDDPAEQWIDQLDARSMLEAFAHALLALGVPLDGEPEAPEGVDWDDHMSPQQTSRFVLKASAARCRVFVNGFYKGSGCLVGPGLVLTAWHVIAVAAPGQPQVPVPAITVQLSDGSTHEATVPPQFESPCSLAEFQQQAPRADTDVAAGHDVALLTLRSPAARHLGFAKLPRPAPAAKSRNTVILAHFPEGKDPGLGFGRTSKIRNVTARWRHDVRTDPGSSGGACFDNRTDFVGIHQGVWDERGLMIPLERFITDVAPHVDLDIAPRRLWALDDADSRLVIGRDLFVESVSAAGVAGSRVRGVWVRRRNIAANQVGLGYSFDILSELLLRRGEDHTLVRITNDAVVPDLLADIRERVVAAGVGLPPFAAPEGAGDNQTAPEGASRATANLLTLAVNGAAEAAGSTVWFFVDNPSVVLDEQSRLDLEAFVAAVQAQPRLRLVLTGLETFTLAGQQFATPGAASGEGLPGLVVEFVGSFQRADLLNFLTQVSEELTGDTNPAELELAADRALLPLHGKDVNGFFEMAGLPPVIAELRNFVALLRQRGPAR
jgi:Trypsin-like peptidase domain